MKSSLIIIIGILLLLSIQSYAQRLGPKTNSSGSTNDLSYSAPRDYEIAEITVSGIKFLDQGALISLSGLKVGEKIKVPGPDISEAVRKLWKQGILGDIKIYATKIEGDKIYLNIDLSERPKLTRFFFSGIRKGQIETLNDKIKLIKGRIVTPSLLKNTQKTIENHFVEKGYLNATANIIQIQDTLISNGVLLKINVNKGTRVKIKELIIEGNEDFSDKKLAKKLKKTKEKKFRIFAASKFIDDKYKEDKEKLISFYRSKGYRDARIINDTVYPIGGDFVGVKIKLEEGNPYYYRNVTWRGNYVYSSDQLSRVLGIKKGDIYDVEELEKRLNFSQTSLDITSLYMDDGYLFFNINPVEIGVEGDSIDVEMQIYEGSQANINKVIINGNTKTNDRVIIREIRTVPGQKFSRSDLIRSQREIATLGYFDPETIGINPVPNIQDGTVDIEYSLTEKPSDQIELSGGWGGAFGFVGTLGLVFNNFSLRKIFKFREWGGVLPSGDGQRLALRLQANGRRFQTYSLTFTEPWLGGKKRNSFSVNISHSVQRTFLTRNEVFGSLTVTGVTFSLGRQLQWPDNFFTLSNSISYLRYGLDNFTNILGFNTGTANNIAFNTTLSRNSIDNPTFPRNGSSLSLSISLTPPYSLFREDNLADKPNEVKFKWVEYNKWLFDNSWFTTLVGNLVLNARMHLGFIGAYNQDLGVGPFERFQLGGDGLTGQNFLLGTEIIGLRGYANNSITPVGESGGVAFNKFVMELRYPVSLNPAATIFVLSFIEGGNNFRSISEYNPFDLKRSVGVGARIFMPAFGMIGLDWGYGFDEVPGTPGASGGRFHFTIGQQFR